ncbi:Uncharacterised protein [Serratia fonticola]|uniref:hypothetical protein n=1 Tax=Serratia fonticola TaxID=47917 RepID=UPI002183A02E|nr:hypothetical protein [Serratia fonticola]CAI2144570.1 Uncharacterised protein [Serratia fonticola]
MSDKLEALSQPVAWTDEVTLLHMGDRKDNYFWPALVNPDDVPFYSQEYVTTLQSALKLEQEQSAYYERHMWHFHGLAESETKRAEDSEQRLELVREQRDNELRTNSELEQRLQQPIKLPNRDATIKTVYAMCQRIPGSTTWNAAEWMYDEIAAGFKVEGE